MLETLTPNAVAGWLGVPEATLAQWRYLGRGPAYAKVGRHIRYRRDDVELWLDQHTRRPQGDAA